MRFVIISGMLLLTAIGTFATAHKALAEDTTRTETAVVIRTETYENQDCHYETRTELQTEDGNVWTLQDYYAIGTQIVVTFDSKGTPDTTDDVITECKRIEL